MQPANCSQTLNKTPNKNYPTSKTEILKCILEVSLATLIRQSAQLHTILSNLAAQVGGKLTHFGSFAQFIAIRLYSVRSKTL